MKKRTISLFLLLAMLVSCSAKDNTADKVDPSETKTDTETVTETVETEETPSLPENLDFGGKSFIFGVVDNPNARNPIVMEELTGEALNDAQFNTVTETNEALNVKIGEVLMESGYPAAQDIINTVTAGDDVIQVANIYCAGVPRVLTGGYVLSYADVPYLDLTKSWWDQKVNETLVLSGIRYAVNGHLTITTHDLTFALIFSKDQIRDNGFESPYDLVKSGEWTIDKMAEYMVAVTKDINGDGKFTEEDNYGYTSGPHMTLPSFWIGAGEKTITLDENEIPQQTMKGERFNNVIEKVFAITYDTGARYNPKEIDGDVPTECITLFNNNRVLFMDCSLFWISTLRDSETDFGIIPYPKFNDSQENYYARVSYFMPSMLPATNKDLELVGAVMEYANYRAKVNITPAYYDIALKGKVSRDEESVEMLDLILANRVVDLGDTLFCASVRDGFLRSMYVSNKRDLASVIEKNETKLQKEIDNMIAGLTETKE